MGIGKSVRSAAAAVLVALLPAGTGLAQEIHVVPRAELHERAVSATQQRRENLSRLERFFSGETAEKALRSARLNGEQVRQAVATLDDEELARLAARAEKANSDFAAGALTNQEITYIIIALGTAVLILIIVAAR